MKSSRKVLYIGVMAPSFQRFVGWVESISPSEMKKLISDLEERFGLADGQPFLEKSDKKWPKPSNERAPATAIVGGKPRPRGRKGERR